VGKGQAWFDYLFLGLDIALGLSKTAYPDPVAPGGFLTYTITYSNTGMEPAQNVEIRDFRDSDTHFVAATPMPLPPSDDEWRLGILATTTGSIVDIVTVDPDTQKNYLFNLARMTSVNQVSNFQPVELTLLVSATIGVVGPDGCAVCIQPPPNEESTLSPGTIPLSHQVHNCGAVTTSITVRVSPPSIWAVTPSTTTVEEVPPDQIRPVVVEITIPPGVPPDTEGDVVWTATTLCGSSSASITDVVHVLGSINFLPAVVKEYYEQPPHDVCSDPIADPCDSGGTDPYEPNNVYCSTQTPLVNICRQAPICPGDPNDSVNHPGDRDDYYYMDIGMARTVEISLTHLPQDYDLYLYHASCCNMEYFDCTGEVAKSDNYGYADEHISYLVPTGKLGRYYIRVYSYRGGFDWKPYTLCANFSPAIASR
jgi:uncharacterized repeat protein (TIGR01451 family)